MIKNRTIQLIFQTAYCAIGMIAFAASLGLFDARFDKDFYVWFTNISNYYCIGIMLAELIQTAKKKEDSYTTIFPKLKFMGVVAILLTFIVFHFLLSGDNTTKQNLSVSSVLLHGVLPVMYIGDWFLCYERKKTKWYFPLMSTLILVAYVLFVFIRVWIINGRGAVVYPYFFMNVNRLGWDGVLTWMGILLIAYVTAGYLLCFIDHIMNRK